MVDRAKRWLKEILRELSSEIEAGIPVVALEPSCAAVFRDELTELFPQDQNARRLAKQTFTLAEFLHEHAQDYQLPRLERRALLHGHCHHKALLNFDCEKELLEKIGVELAIPDSGCCGMAGAFGFEKDHYEVSIACGERVLLPEVRKAASDTLIIADGFSCREQISQLTDRRALHLAEVLKLATDASVK
jgi:Fe-S oxidoreductase